jgi:hypothetical protein
MGNTGDVYERHYMPSFIDADCQGIYLGTPRREDVVRAVGRLERYEGAPDKLTEDQKNEIKNDHKIVKWICDRGRYAREIKQDYSTIKAAKGTLLYMRHNKAQRKINNRKSKLRNRLLEKAIDEFHETVHFDEVDRQMRGILPDTEILTPSTIKYELEERATVARLLFLPLDDLNEDQVFDVRVQLVHALAQLCHRQETTHKLKATKLKRHLQTRFSTDTDDDDEVFRDGAKGNTLAAGDLGTQTVDERSHTDSMLNCPFCELGPFSRKDSLGRHVRVQHLQRLTTTNGFSCPFNGCWDFMGNPEHFLSHTALRHQILL